MVGAVAPASLVLLGNAADDGEREAALLARKTAELRIFSDAATARRFNLSCSTPAAPLVVSQFTLYADVRRGRRPGYRAGLAGAGQPLVARCAAHLAGMGVAVAGGRFGAHMHVTLENDGPVTVVLDTTLWTAKG
ncbi:MAG: D-aminoacyl-tRNA deacylase [Dehalococcoidia bacterium]